MNVLLGVVIFAAGALAGAGGFAALKAKTKADLKAVVADVKGALAKTGVPSEFAKIEAALAKL